MNTELRLMLGSSKANSAVVSRPLYFAGQTVSNLGSWACFLILLFAYVDSVCSDYGYEPQVSKIAWTTTGPTMNMIKHRHLLE